MNTESTYQSSGKGVTYFSYGILILVAVLFASISLLQAQNATSTNNATTTNATSSNNVTTTTSTTTVTLSQLQSRIAALEIRVTNLERHSTTTLKGRFGNIIHSVGNQKATTAKSSVVVRPGLIPGSSVDFIGTNFGREEDVVVMSDGATIITAHADGSGNFSTGSIPVPTTNGSKTYTFVGLKSGITTTVTLSLPL